MKTCITALALSGSVGSTSSNGTTDIPVYGGIVMASGQESNELWILRLHPVKMTGNGTASCVNMAYLPSCATPTPKKANNSTSNSNSSLTNPGSSSSPSMSDLAVSKKHEFLTAIHFAVLLICVTALRYKEPGLLSFSRMWRMPRLWALFTAWFGIFAAIIVFLLGLTKTPSNKAICPGCLTCNRLLCCWVINTFKSSLGLQNFLQILRMCCALRALIKMRTTSPYFISNATLRNPKII